jgi:hypothetical protein
MPNAAAIEPRSRAAIAAAAIGAWGALVALAPDAWSRLAIASPAFAIALYWAALRIARRWAEWFLFAAVLLPPLPIALGDSGPHPGLALAALGLVAGAMRWRQWRGRVQVLEWSFAVYWLALLASAALAIAWSGARIGALSLARVGLFGIGIYLYYYVAHGPGAESRAGSWRVAKWLYRAGVVSALFACVDFYFQWPPPAGFGEQFVWLAGGVYRRAQGVFYEASSLGNVCAFFLAMAAVSLSRRRGESPIGRMEAVAGAGVLFAALMLSFSRASVLNVAAAGAALLYLHRGRVRGTPLAIAAGAGLLAAYYAMPQFVEFYWRRLWGSIEVAASEGGAVLSGRLESWSHLIGWLWENPWQAMLGVGYKTLAYSDVTGRQVVADNAFLSALIETGVIGLAAMLAFNWAILRRGFRAARSPEPRVAFFGTWIACFWVGELAQMMSGDLLTYWRLLPLYFWALAQAREG